jgi:hypothetical protein
MAHETGLRTFWITFPKETGCSFPFGAGVTAWSEEDAIQLLKERGIDVHRAREFVVKPDVTIADLDPSNVVRYMGPIVVRGVWFPVGNVGWGAP